MRNVCILLLLLFVNSLTAQILTQNHYRWRNDDGSETEATWRQDEDVAATVMQNTKIRLRIEMYRDGDGSDLQFSLFYHTDTDVQPGWYTGTQLTTDDSENAFILTTTDYYDQDDMVTDQLTTTPGYAHATGWCNEEDSLKTISLLDKADIEIEYCIMPTSNSVVNSTYYFTVRLLSGLGWDVYTLLPEIEILENTLPVELTAFSAQRESGGILLQWNTASEKDNLGFVIERRYSEQDDWQQIASYLARDELEGQGTKTTDTDYEFWDHTIKETEQVWYRLSNVDRDGVVEISDVTYLDLRDSLPLTFGLEQAYPNPFNPATTIPYRLAQDADVELVVYDVLGRLVTTLVNQSVVSAGQYTVSWQGVDDAGAAVPGGVYFIRLSAGGHTDYQKVLLVK